MACIYTGDKEQRRVETECPVYHSLADCDSCRYRVIDESNWQRRAFIGYLVISDVQSSLCWDVNSEYLGWCIVAILDCYRDVTGDY